MGHIVEELIGGFNPDDREWYEIELPMKAMVKKRPRFGRYTTYSDPKQEAFERELKERLGKYWDGYEPLARAVEVSVIFNFKYPTTSKHCFPSSMDIDNLLKAVFDGANGVLWNDDRQINKIFSVEKRFAEEDSIVIRFTEGRVETKFWRRLKNNWKFIG
jgi:Holliday junction resolvase RusA-like endonuclease